MLTTGLKLPATVFAGLAVVSMAAMPVVSWADASAPGVGRMHKAKHKVKPRHRVVRAQAVQPPAPQPAPPVEVVQEAPPPPVEAPPAPAVVEAPPAPAPAPAAPLAVAKHGHGLLIGLIAAAAIAAGVILAADSNKKPVSA